MALFSIQGPCNCVQRLLNEANSGEGMFASFIQCQEKLLNVYRAWCYGLRVYILIVPHGDLVQEPPLEATLA